MSKEQLQTLSNDDILAAAEQIIAQEEVIQKSEKEENLGKKMADAVDKIAEGEAKEEVEDHEDKMHKKDKSKKEDEMKEKEMKKSQADIEGKETGGLAPSVQGSLADAGNGSEGGSEDQANPKSKKHLMQEGDPASEGGKESKATQEGDSEEEANKKAKKHLMRENADPSAEGGGSDGRGQTGSSQDQANQGQMFNLMKKSLETLAKSVAFLNSKVEALEKSQPKEDREEIRKSVQAETIEVIAKSYNKKIRSLESDLEGKTKEQEELKKSFTAQFEELKKSVEETKKEMLKPARTRETATNYDIIKKGNSEDAGRQVYKSKEEVLEKLEELRKSNKVSGDELISFNVSGHMTENVKKQLAK